MTGINPITVALSNTGEQCTVSDAALNDWAKQLIETILLEAAKQAGDLSVVDSPKVRFDIVVESPVQDKLSICVLTQK